ncbi:MAG TPA: hypothetical protein VMU20_11100 [Candidatus Dormibacteraeota bacterium]|nr:hypothetical protein [Candidatus Dormibacteraeota bacterium]
MRVALCGAFDTADGERQAERRVVTDGLLGRLPGCAVSAYSAQGRLLAIDGGRPARPLPRTEEELTEFAAAHDCLVTIGDPPGGLGARLPAVRADLADGGGALPPLALLLPHRIDPALLRGRTELLRLLGWAWPQGPVLTLEGDAALAESVDALCAALRPLVERGAVTVQLAVSAEGRGEEEFAGAVESALGGSCRRLPEVAAVEDLVALVAASAAYLGPAGLGLWTAVALGVPAAAPAVAPAADHDALLAGLDIARISTEELATALPALLAGERGGSRALPALERLEGHLDTVAVRVVEAARGHGWTGARPEETGDELTAATRLEALRVAHEARGLRLVAERRVAEAAREATARALGAAVEEAGAEVDRLRSELAAARAANDRMVASRTWRYTQPVRDTLARVRERRR